LGLAFQVYFTGIESLSQQEVSQTAQDTITSVDCQWITFDSKEYQCHELFFKNKKPQSLGADASKILIGCIKCKQGRKEQDKKQTIKMLKGLSIKTFRNLNKVLIEIVKSGMPGDVTFCNRLDPPVGTGMPTIFCTKYDRSVDINKVCKDSPCEFLEQYHIMVHSEFAANALAQIEKIAAEYEQLEGPDPTPIKKDIEVEQVEPDEEVDPNEENPH